MTSRHIVTVHCDATGCPISITVNATFPRSRHVRQQLTAQHWLQLDPTTDYCPAHRPDRTPTA